MSDTPAPGDTRPGDNDPGEPRDPLTALRRADTRPLLQRLSDRARLDIAPGRASGPAVALVASTAVVIAFIGWRLVHDAQPPIEDTLPLAVAAPETSTTAEQSSPAVVVHVAGAVRRPGLVTGESGWRVADAVSAAGGVTGEADTDRINLARAITDGERIFVPAAGEPVPAIAGGDGASDESESVGPIDLNTANAAELEELPGVGPATAASIVEHRESNGSFGTVDALVAVRGIGPATLERLRPHVTVG